MERQIIMESLQRAATEVLGIDAPQLEERLKLGDDAELDSLDLIEMSMLIEDEYAISFDASDFDDLQSIADVVDLIAHKIDAVPRS